MVAVVQPVLFNVIFIGRSKKMRFKTQILAVFLLLAFCGAICAADVNGLIAHWKLDEGSGDTAYDSAGNNDANVYGAAWTSGIIDGALDFNGVSDYADCGSSFASVAGSATKTIMAWAKPDTADTGTRVLTLYRRSDYYSAFSLYPRVSGGPATWTGLYATAGNGYDVLDSGLTVNTGIWTHVALVQNGADVHIYVNGVLKNSANNAAAPIISNPPNATMGAYKWYNDLSGLFDGLIDDVRIYDRALSTEEIEGLYLEGASAYRRAVINIEDAIAEKTEAMEKVNAAMAKEQKARDAISELLRGGDYGDLSKRDIIRALVKVHQAMQSEKQSLHFLDKSVEMLEGSLANLGLDPNLVAHWRLDEGGGDTAYDSAGDNDGTLVNGPSWASGQINGGLSFDGLNDYVDCGNDGSLDITDSITVAAWVKRPNFQTHGTIAGKTNGNSVTAGYGLFSYKEGLEFNFYSGGWRRTKPRFTISANEWHYVVGTFDGNTAYLYVDGERKTSVAHVGTIAPAAGHPFNIGFWRSALPTYFKGKIDDVRIYDRALSAEEVQQLYKDGK